MVRYRLRMDLRIGINLEEHLFHSSQHYIHAGRVFRSGTVSVALPVVEQEPINGFRLICFNQLQPGGPLRPAAAGDAEALALGIAVNADLLGASDRFEAFGHLVLIDRAHGENLSILIESFFPADNFPLRFQFAFAFQREELDQDQ